MKVKKETVVTFKVGDKVFTNESDANEYLYELELKEKRKDNPNHDKYYEEIVEFMTKLNSYYDDNHEIWFAEGAKQSILITQLRHKDFNDDDFFIGEEYDGEDYPGATIFFVDVDELDNITEKIYNKFLKIKDKFRIYKVTKTLICSTNNWK